MKGVAEFLQNLDNVKGFVDVHSYSQLWMTPWGYTTNLPKDFKEQVYIVEILFVKSQLFANPNR